MLCGIRNRKMRFIRQKATKEESKKAKLIRALNKQLDLNYLEIPRYRWMDKRTRRRIPTPPQLWKVRFVCIYEFYPEIIKTGSSHVKGSRIS